MSLPHEINVNGKPLRFMNEQELIKARECFDSLDEAKGWLSKRLVSIEDIAKIRANARNSALIEAAELCETTHHDVCKCDRCMEAHKINKRILELAEGTTKGENET